MKRIERRAGRGERGGTLAETMLALLLLMVCAGPLMSVALTGQVSEGRAERRLAAVAAVESVAEALKSYQTGDRRLARGPGVGPDGWRLPGDDRAWAFEEGVHRLDPRVWARDLAPHGVKLRYTVEHRETPGGIEPVVRFAVDWEER